jgi:hypothetical protein
MRNDTGLFVSPITRPTTKMFSDLSTDLQVGDRISVDDHEILVMVTEFRVNASATPNALEYFQIENELEGVLLQPQTQFIPILKVYCERPSAMLSRVKSFGSIVCSRRDDETPNQLVRRRQPRVGLEYFHEMKYDSLYEASRRA